MTDPLDLEQVLRHLEPFRALHETEGISFLTGPGGVTWCLADLEQLAVIAAQLPSCQASAVSSLIADRFPVSRCLPAAMTVLCAVYDTARIWRKGVPGGFRYLFGPCAGCALAAA